jgi:RNA recognition motif. (a.k.a. RRM, RBD, or RNP domain)
MALPLLAARRCTCALQRGVGLGWQRQCCSELRDEHAPLSLIGKPGRLTLRIMSAGGFPDLHEQHGADAGGGGGGGGGNGRARFNREGRPPSNSSASPPRKPSAEGGGGGPGGGGLNALVENLQNLSFVPQDDKRNSGGGGGGNGGGGRSAAGANAGAAAGARMVKRPGVEELEEARLRTVYVSDLNKGLTETELVRWFSSAGHVLECRICSDMNTTKRFAFVEFADAQGFENGAATPCMACLRCRRHPLLPCAMHTQRYPSCQSCRRAMCVQRHTVAFCLPRCQLTCSFLGPSAAKPHYNVCLQFDQSDCCQLYGDTAPDQSGVSRTQNRT